MPILFTISVPRKEDYSEIGCQLRIRELLFGENKSYEDERLPVVLSVLCLSFSEIIKNAIDAKATKITVNCHFDSIKNYASLTIIDNGEGFPASMVDPTDSKDYLDVLKGNRKLQSKKESDKLGGNGLGLALAQQLLGSYKGNLTIANKKMSLTADKDEAAAVSSSSSVAAASSDLAADQSGAIIKLETPFCVVPFKEVSDCYIEQGKKRERKSKMWYGMQVEGEVSLVKSPSQFFLKRRRQRKAASADQAKPSIVLQPHRKRSLDMRMKEVKDEPLRDRKELDESRISSSSSAASPKAVASSGEKCAESAASDVREDTHSAKKLRFMGSRAALFLVDDGAAAGSEVKYAGICYNR